jgi:hypothetical protein
MWLPPLLALPWALPAWKRRLQRRDPRYLLPLAWWALVVLFFSLPHGKRETRLVRRPGITQAQARADHQQREDPEQPGVAARGALVGGQVGHARMIAMPRWIAVRRWRFQRLRRRA